MGKADRGDKLTVTETKQAGSYLWGKTSKGWIALKYTSYSKAPETGKDEPVTPPAQTQQPVAGSTGVTTADSLNIRKGAGTGYARVGAYPMGSKITILETKMVGASTWGRTDKGWISLNYVKLDPVKEDTKPDNTKPEETKPEETKPEDTKPSQPETTVPPAAPEKTMGTITGDALRIRSGAGITYSVKGFLNKGDRVEILETKTVGTMTWGKTDKGWISMDYVKLDQAPVTQAKTGKVKDGVSLRVRSGPNDSYAITGFIAGGTAVTVTETKQVGNTLWGKVDNGWVNMDFIVLDGAVEEKPEASVIRGTVTATSLRIRAGAGTNYETLGQLVRGNKVEILEQKTVGSNVWGRIEKGWICLTGYVDLETVTENQGGNTEPEKPVEPQPPVEPEPPEVVTKTFGTVTYSYLRIRAGAGTNFASLGQLKKGDRVEILETKTAGGVRWGRFEKGWICLTGYVELETVKVEQPKEETGIITADVLNVRTGAGTNYSVTCQLIQGTKVVILEKKTVNGTVWGRIEQGWISMDYVD